MTDAPKQSLPKQDLANMFGRGPKAELLPRPAASGALPPGEEPSVQPVQPEPETTAQTRAPDAGAKQKRGARKAQARRTGTTTSSADTDVTEAQVIYLPADLRARVTAFRSERSATNAIVVLDAIDSLVTPGSKDPFARLRALVDESLVPQPTKSIFDREPKSAISRASGTVQFAVRITPKNWAVIGQIVEATGAASPAHLITVALTEYLANQGEQR